MQSKELNAKIKCFEKEETHWNRERNRYEEEILALSKKNEEVEAKLWNLSRSYSYYASRNKSVTNTPAPKQSNDDLDKEWPALRPSIKGVR